MNVLYSDNSALMMCRFANETTIVTTQHRPLTSGFAHLLHSDLTVSVSSLNVIAEMHQTRGDTLDAYLLFRCSVEGASITHHYPEQNHPSPSRTPQVTSYPSLLLEQHDMGIFLTKYFLSECSCSARPRRVAQLVLESRNLARWFLSAATCK